MDCLQGCPCTFSPEIVQAGAVKGLMVPSTCCGETVACSECVARGRVIRHARLSSTTASTGFDPNAAASSPRN